MAARSDRAKVTILKALHEIGRAAGSSRIVRRLGDLGMPLQPRTVRLYLQQLDREGLTRFMGRRIGREITDRGIEELARSHVIEKVGFIAAKVDTLGYRMSFSNRVGSGTIVANVALFDQRVLRLALKEIEEVFAAGLGMGRLLALAQEGGKLADLEVPAGRVAVATICSVTVNGILLHEGIPVTSRFGGLLEMRDGAPVRFVELIDYSGTTLDPLEAFIRAGMTDVRQCARTGAGIIGASFREIPSAAVEDVTRIERSMRERGLGGILAIGSPNRPLLDIPVAEGRAGIIVVGGLNPVAAVHESGIRLSMLSLAGLDDIARFEVYENVCRQRA